MPSVSIGSSVARKPAVSMIVSGTPWISISRRHGVACRAGDRRDDGHRVAGQPVEKARLADVGSADEHDGEPVAQQRALLRAGLHTRSTCAAIAAILPRTSAARSEGDVLFRKIERGLDVHPELDQRVDERADLVRKRAGQAAGRGARRRRRRGVDQIRHTLGLREVELAVEERALRELSRPREARAQFDAAREQQAQHRGPAVAVQLEHVLARVRPRCRKVEGEALVERFAGAPSEGGAGCHARDERARAACPR